MVPFGVVLWESQQRFAQFSSLQVSNGTTCRHAPEF